jgi:hypothetical protein
MGGKNYIDYISEFYKPEKYFFAIQCTNVEAFGKQVKFDLAFKIKT